MRFLLVTSAVASSFLTIHKSYPPESCSCACCVVQPAGSCGMPGPQHWKHHACNYGLCGDAEVLANNGPLFAAKQKQSFCESHCVPMNAPQGENCSCRSDPGGDKWKCPHG